MHWLERCVGVVWQFLECWTSPNSSWHWLVQLSKSPTAQSSNVIMVQWCEALLDALVGVVCRSWLAGSLWWNVGLVGPMLQDNPTPAEGYLCYIRPLWGFLPWRPETSRPVQPLRAQLVAGDNCTLMHPKYDHTAHWPVQISLMSCWA